MPGVGVLLMAHGTPSSLDEMPAYLALVRGGRAASPELVAEMRRNYEAIGGRSPLTDITMAQADALRGRLGDLVPVAVGMRNWRPFIPEAVAALLVHGVARIIAIPLAPQFSTLSAKKYIDTAIAAVPSGIDLDAVRSFQAHPVLLDAFAERVRAARPADDEAVVFTAHSLPVRVIEQGDEYAPELGALVAKRAAEGVGRFLVVPVGFVCDHTEILFDIDVQAAGVATAAGATLRRTESLNTSPAFISVLEDLVKTRLLRDNGCDALS